MVESRNETITLIAILQNIFFYILFWNNNNDKNINNLVVHMTYESINTLHIFFQIEVLNFEAILFSLNSEEAPSFLVQKIWNVLASSSDFCWQCGRISKSKLVYLTTDGWKIYTLVMAILRGWTRKRANENICTTKINVKILYIKRVSTSTWVKWSKLGCIFWVYELSKYFRWVMLRLYELLLRQA